ncbi:hypothetical protein AVEN_113391-1 [Araneus ventricosus]|uniref:Uncharacterized protein n=1 Tax=Araneus ventricosus TaxID=182803 RepID=A0A4Y2NW07_ARAVE|nr:hypothetical protein AVEN_113391-1 [Araneus ventricosus]
MGPITRLYHHRCIPRGNENRHAESDSFSPQIEGGVLRVINGGAPNPPAGVTSVIGVEVTQPHTIFVSTREAKTGLPIQRLHFHELAVPPGKFTFITLEFSVASEKLFESHLGLVIPSASAKCSSALLLDSVHEVSAIHAHTVHTI